MKLIINNECFQKISRPPPPRVFQIIVTPQTLSDFPFPQDKVNPFNDFQICDKNIFHTQEPLEIIFLPLKAFRS